MLIRSFAMQMLSPEVWAIMGLAVLVTIALLTTALWLRQERLRAVCDAQRIFEQLDLLRGELLLLGDRLDSMQPGARVTERTAPAAPLTHTTASGPGPRGYEVAARLARGGATCEELISGCGLSRHEAELLLRINKAEAERARMPDAVPGKATVDRRSRLSMVG
jgi:heme exporter protein D